MRIKLYGGPGHGKIVTKNARRIEVRVPKPFRPILYCPETCIDSTPSFETCSYYVTNYREDGVTEGGKRVYREIKAALWEEEPLLPRDEFELRRDLSKQPWLWSRVPCFLHEFDAWWEMKLYQVCGVNPVRYW